MELILQINCIHNPHTGVHIEEEKDDPNYQETAMALYNQALQSDTYINNCRLENIQNTSLTPEQIDAQRNAFAKLANTKLQIHLWAIKDYL